LIRTFWHRGPNGNHLCLVLELAGPKIESYMKHCPSGSFSLVETQKVALDTTMALAYLHAERYVHGGEQLHSTSSPRPRYARRTAATPSNSLLRYSRGPQTLNSLPSFPNLVSPIPTIKNDLQTRPPFSPNTPRSILAKISPRLHAQ
jgi:hypothetical protein